jgi:hypothetical protein
MQGEDLTCTPARLPYIVESRPRSGVDRLDHISAVAGQSDSEFLLVPSIARVELDRDVVLGPQVDAPVVVDVGGVNEVDSPSRVRLGLQKRTRPTNWTEVEGGERVSLRSTNTRSRCSLTRSQTCPVSPVGSVVSLNSRILGIHHALARCEYWWVSTFEHPLGCANQRAVVEYELDRRKFLTVYEMPAVGSCFVRVTAGCLRPGYPQTG